MREGSAPNFCPPTEEGITLVFEDESGDRTELEFLGLILHNDRSYGFFFPVTEDEPVGSSGEVVLLEVTELDEDGQPSAFEIVEDEAVAAEVYEDFRTATKDLYDFSAYRYRPSGSQPLGGLTRSDWAMAATYMISWLIACSRRHTSSSVSAYSKMRAAVRLIVSISSSYSVPLMCDLRRSCSQAMTLSINS